MLALGNRGIGFHTAMHLAQRGVTVILACRSEKTGKAAAAKINAAVGREAASAVALDLASLDVRHGARVWYYVERACVCTWLGPMLCCLLSAAAASSLQRRWSCDGMTPGTQL